MADSRARSPNTSDEEMDNTSRNVRARQTLLPNDPYRQPATQTEESDPEEEPMEDMDPEEEPMEEEEPQLNSPDLPHPNPFPVVSPPANPPPVSPPPSNVPSTSNPNPPPPEALLWNWMPIILDWWRRDEQVPVLPRIPGDNAPDSPFTNEPAYSTIPVLISRLRSHERILEWLERKVETRTGAPAHELEELHQQVLGVEGELIDLREDVATINTRGILTRDEVVVLREEQNQTRQRLTALEQEIEALKTEREQFKADAEASARLSDILGRMGESLLR